MNLVDWRSSTWKTMARLRSRPSRARWRRAKPPEPLGADRARRRPRPGLRERLAHGALEDRDEQVVLAAEVEVDGAGGDAGGARDVGDLGVEEAALGEDVDRGAQDRVALGELGAVGPAASGVQASWHGTE